MADTSALVTLTFGLNLLSVQNINQFYTSLSYRVGNRSITIQAEINTFRAKKKFLLNFCYIV